MAGASDSSRAALVAVLKRRGSAEDIKAALRLLIDEDADLYLSSALQHIGYALLRERAHYTDAR